MSYMRVVELTVGQWVVSDNCSSADCASVSRYSQTSSKDLKSSGVLFELSYLKGSVSGVVALDVVSIGPFEIRPQIFGLVHDTKDMNLASNGYSGILGLCFPSEASISPNVAPTVLQNLFEHLDEPYFAIKLGNNPGPYDLTSSLTFGQLDERYASHLSDFYFTPVSTAGATGYTYWKLPFQTFIVNGLPIQLSPSVIRGTHGNRQIAVIDTGSTLMLGPTSDVDAIWGAVGSAARYNTDEKMWEVRCNKAVDVQIVFGDKNHHIQLPIDYEDVNWDGGNGSGWCMGGIQANDDVDSGDWLLGDAFLRSVYTVHFIGNATHPPSIGFLGTIDRNVTHEQFRAKRGPDLDQSSEPSPRIQGRSTMPAAPMLYTIGSAGGFVGGAAAMTAFRVRRRFLGAYQWRSKGSRGVL
ncbi:acid protease [Marasmius fiardii PR-910]|nr:acid protease [Marasmius fiardii PR-910]